MKKIFEYNLLHNAFSKKDLNEGVKVLKSGQLTMSKKTSFFEKYFAKKNKSNYALMVNSGSSANLLSVAAACNPMRPNYLKRGDEVLIPAVCWSTSLWPLVQYGLKPVFVDINLSNLNMSLDELKKKVTKKTKAIMCVHLLGLSSDMTEIMKFSKRYKLIVFEDTCESLGSQFKSKNLGNFGDFGTYSFYYSHQITSGEGGMIVCKNEFDYNLLKSLRSHGWSRNTIFHNYYKKKYKELDDRFLFINSGYNLRPLDISAAIALSKYKILKKFIKIRYKNRELIIKMIKEHPKWNNQFKFIFSDKNINPSWFGLAILINKKIKIDKKNFLNYLNLNRVENRPIVSGNFLNQPAIKLYNLKTRGSFKNSNFIQKNGFFIGLHTKKISNLNAKRLAEIMIKIDNFKL